MKEEFHRRLESFSSVRSIYHTIWRLFAFPLNWFWFVGIFIRKKDYLFDSWSSTEISENSNMPTHVFFSFWHLSFLLHLSFIYSFIYFFLLILWDEKYFYFLWYTIFWQPFVFVYVSFEFRLSWISVSLLVEMRTKQNDERFKNWNCE